MMSFIEPTLLYRDKGKLRTERRGGGDRMRAVAVVGVGGAEN